MSIYIVDEPFGQRLEISIADLHREAIENNEHIDIPDKGENHFLWGVKRSNETKEKMRKAWRERKKVGVSLITRKRMSIAQKNTTKEKVECPECGKIGGKPAMMRFHFDKCKVNL